MAYTVPKLTDYSAAALEKAASACADACASEMGTIRTDADLKTFRDRWLARKNGILTQINDLWLKSAPKAERPVVGQKVNWLKKHVEGLVEVAGNRLLLQRAPATQYRTVVSLDFGGPVDITLPGARRPIGAEHPVIRTMHEIVSVFQKLGYSVAEGPVVETDYYNFEALNFPPDHPARDTQDTLFIAGQESKPQRERLLLRTHTSPVQIRTMEKMRPPIRIVIPGTVHRNDPPDASHSPMFHQIEGLAVDTNITFGDLKGTLDHAMKALFGSNVKTHFRPSFFPFTEPSAELYVTCFICGGSGKRGADACRPCKQTGWIEVLGCGMVDPNVFEFVKDNGYDPKKVSGFAFGMGVDRLALLKYGVDDLQYFFQGDVRFLEQFG
ncbi:phenylalanine tRNA synthetase, alpha subunit [Candidatus Sulfotelmatobacter kueseliae]|uniref:Phenylalanine--tRNA ligase alpha subunit n=1 Tax=Candidatus Sulfotelmatobacter kueseliae TaxID=2042962 RepID=A0A2U3KYF6_9BACT|nr:phenylalanine tRNA synthetase, alpha subunit [Candidatus Sulfotelmatobacter kueseliae]